MDDATKAKHKEAIAYLEKVNEAGTSSSLKLKTALVEHYENMEMHQQIIKIATPLFDSKVRSERVLGLHWAVGALSVLGKESAAEHAVAKIQSELLGGDFNGFASVEEEADWQEDEALYRAKLDGLVKASSALSGMIVPDEELPLEEEEGATANPKIAELDEEAVAARTAAKAAEDFANSGEAKGDAQKKKLLEEAKAHKKRAAQAEVACSKNSVLQLVVSLINSHATSRSIFFLLLCTC
jgi:hypothetical protein